MVENLEHLLYVSGLRNISEDYDTQIIKTRLATIQKKFVNIEKYLGIMRSIVYGIVGYEETLEEIKKHIGKLYLFLLK